MTPRVLVFHRAASIYERLLREAIPELDFVVTDDEQVFRKELPQSDILVSLGFPPDAAASAARLRWVQSTGSGIEDLLPACQLVKDVRLTNARGIHSDLMADYVFGAMIMMQWDMPGLMRAQAARRWERKPRRSIDGSTLGIVGLGPIGLEVARRAPAFGLKVLGINRSGNPAEGFDAVYPAARLREILPLCDFVLLAVPTTNETRNMIGAAELAEMKRDAVLINISRGMVVDEPELIAALQAGRIGGAVLDVFAKEPLPEDSPLWALPNVIMTPHIAGMAATNEERFVALFLDNLERYLDDRPLRNAIDVSRGY